MRQKKKKAMWVKIYVTVLKSNEVRRGTTFYIATKGITYVWRGQKRKN